MYTNRIVGAWSLIAVSLLSVIVFLIHPIAPDHAALIGRWGINAITHSLGVGLLPLLLFGCWCLGEWLGLNRPLVRFALCCNLLVVVLTAVAGLTSGWITSAGYELGHDFGKLAVAINRACDRGYVAFTALGMIANGLAFPPDYRSLRLFSLLIGALPLAWVLSGSFDPQVHPMLVLTLGQLIWWVSAAQAMLRSPAD